MLTSKKKNRSKQVVMRQTSAPSRIRTIRRPLQPVRMHLCLHLSSAQLLHTDTHALCTQIYILAHATVLTGLLYPIPIFRGIPSPWPLWIQPYIYTT